MKSASSYQLNGKIYIQGHAIVRDGPKKLYGEVSTNDIEDYVCIGKNILDKLDKAGSIIPPTSREEYKAAPFNQSPMIVASGMKTWSALEKKSRSVDLELKDNEVIITPTKYGTPDSKRAYAYLTDKALTSSLDPETLGRTLIKAFELCE